MYRIFIILGGLHSFHSLHYIHYITFITLNQLPLKLNFLITMVDFALRPSSCY